MLSSFAEMESLGIYHSDIKPHNFLVDEFWNIKIIDFSISLIKNKDLTESATELHPIQGTEGYRAPEIEAIHNLKEIKGSYKVGKADVFSLGIVFLQMMLLIPLKNYNTPERNNNLMQLIDDRIQFEWARQLFKNMLNINPSERSRFSNLINYLPLQLVTPSVNIP